MTAKKQVKYDLDGYEVVKDAILELINKCPVIEEKISFGVLGEAQGFAMIPVSSSIVESARKSVTGKVKEICYYPFALVYRDAGMTERRKSSVSEILDNAGKWLERQEISVNGNTYRLTRYPILTGNRDFLEIKRQTNSYLARTYEDKAEDWEIRITARYTNEYI